MCITVSSVPSIPNFIQNVRKSLHLENEILIFPSNATGDIVEMLDNKDLLDSMSVNTIISCEEGISLSQLNATNELVTILLSYFRTTIALTTASHFPTGCQYFRTSFSLVLGSFSPKRSGTVSRSNDRENTAIHVYSIWKFSYNPTQRPEQVLPR